MIVISDSSPINHMTRAGLVHLLPAMLQTVIVPEAVHRELQHARTPDVVRKMILSEPDWLEVRHASPVIDADLDELDPGEREAILLYEELNADLLMIDEQLGRRIAGERGIALTGTLGFIERAANRGLVEFRQALCDLKLSGFYINPVLERDYLIRFPS